MWNQMFWEQYLNFQNIEEKKKIILFGAMNSTSDENKGFKYLQQAIKKLHLLIGIVNFRNNA